MHLGEVSEVVDVNLLRSTQSTGQVTMFAGLPDQVQERIWWRHALRWTPSP